MSLFRVCVGVAVISMAAADTFVFDARNCNSDGDNAANYATSSMLSYSGSGSIPSSLQFAGEDGDVASHTFQPVNMLLKAGNYAVGELELPDGISIEFADGMAMEVTLGATASPAIFTGGQYVKPECDANCMNNWLKYIPSAQNPGAQPQMNPTLDYSAMPTATSLPCLSDDVYFHYSSSYVIDAYGTQMFNSLNYRNVSIAVGSASTITAIRGGDTMYLGANASAACQAMGMTDSSCVCLTSCAASTEQRNAIREQIQAQAEILKQESVLAIRGSACVEGTPITSTLSFYAGQGMLQSDIYALTLGTNLAALEASICQTINDETCASECTISRMTLANPQGSISRRNTGLATEVFNITLSYRSPAAFDDTQEAALIQLVNAIVTSYNGGGFAKCMSLSSDVDYTCVETEVKDAAAVAYDGTKSMADITSELEVVYKNARGCSIQELGAGLCSYSPTDDTFSVMGGFDAAATSQMNTVIANALAAVTTVDPSLSGKTSGDEESSASFPIIPIAAGAAGLLIIIIIIVVVTRGGSNKDDDNSRDVVAFQNPMYDSPEEKQNPVADGGEGLYDDPQMMTQDLGGGAGQSDVELDTNDMYADGHAAEHNDDSAGLYDDGTGDGGYLDVAETADADDDDEDDDDGDEDGDEDDDEDDDDYDDDDDDEEDDE